MPETRDVRRVAEALRGLKALRTIERSLASLEVRRAGTTSAADIAAIEAKANRLRKRAEGLAGQLPPARELDALRRTLDTATNSEDFGGVVASEVPVLLLPIRLQTRFVPLQGGNVELRIRFIPDAIAVHAHEPELTPDELALGAAYWANAGAGADADERLAAWTVLVTAALGSERAAWIALRTDPNGDVDAAALERLYSWTRAAAVDVLPEHFTVRAYHGGALLFETTTTPIIPASLDVGFDPNTPGAGAADATSIEELMNGLPPQLGWLTDFGEAEKIGMALRVGMSAADAQAGIDRLIVLGVRTGADADHGALLVQELLDAHHYTEGLAIAPRGAPTNNTEDAGSWFRSNRPPSESLPIEREAPLFDPEDPGDLGLDGPLLARALGINPDTFAHVRGADGSDQREGGLMALALWPATWGYYLKEVLASTVAEDSIARLRRHFIAQVRGRGPLPPLQAGRNPYGVLPVLSLERRAGAPWSDQDRDVPPWLPRLLAQLQQDWLRMTDSAPRVGRTGDVAKDLYDVMTMQATSATFASSAVYGEEFTGTSAGFLDLWGVNWGGVFNFLQPSATELQQLARHLGLDHRELPRLATFVGDAPVPVQGLDVVHGQVGPQPLPGAPNYIAWLATASAEDIRAERGVPAGAGNTMLYRVLRHSVLSAYVETAKTIKRQMEGLPALQQFEPELVEMPGVQQPSPYSHLDAYFVPPGGVAQVRIGDYLSRLDRPYVTRSALGAAGQVLPAWLTEFIELRTALLALSQVPTERLQLLFTETLDCCSHRLDAWITSLATRRLDDMRRSQETAGGLYVGAYGWVEDLKPKAAPAGGGFVLAPSSSHATAAAMLRSGYLSRGGAPGSPLAVELSSHRVKQALWMFDAIRAGNSLAAVLGYRFERMLHDAPVNLGLEQFLPALRAAFPIDTGALTEPNGPAEAISARDVVNGLALHEAWLAFAPRVAAEPGLNLFANPGLPTGASPAGMTMLALLSQLDQLYDAMADVALCESVFQVGRGQYERAGAVAAAMAGARQMPEIEVTATPRTGTTIRNRVLLSLDPAPPDAFTGWGNARSPRAAASPELNQWLAAAVGDPGEIRALVRYVDGAGEQVAWLGLTELEVDAIDLVACFSAADTARESELEQRMRYRLTEQDDARTNIEISFDDAPPWAGTPARPAGTRTVSEVAELLRTLQRLVGTARAAGPADLAPPDEASEAPQTDLDLALIGPRARAALSGMWDAYSDLLAKVMDAREEERKRIARNIAATAAGNAPAVADEAPAVAATLDDIRVACFELAWYGVQGAVIPDQPEPAAADVAGRTTLWSSVIARAEAVLKEVEKRLMGILDVATPAGIGQAAIDAALGAIDGLSATAEAIVASVGRCGTVLRGVFGKGFVVTQPFVLGAAHPLRASHTTASANALVGATQDEMARWLFQVSQAHPTLSELELATIMSAAQTTRGSFALSAAQLPFAAGDRWAALERPGRFPPGLLAAAFIGDVRFSDAAGERFTGLVLAEWEEVVPNKTELAALTFQFDQPASEPPQALLLAVPATRDAAVWTRSELFEVLENALTLARIRTVDPDLLKTYGRVLPALYFTQNFANEAPSTSFQVLAQPLAVTYQSAEVTLGAAAPGGNG